MGKINAVLCNRSGVYLEQRLSRLFVFAQMVDDPATCAVRMVRSFRESLIFHGQSHQREKKRARIAITAEESMTISLAIHLRCNP